MRVKQDNNIIKLTIVDDIKQDVNENYCEIKIYRNFLDILCLSAIQYLNSELLAEITDREKEVLKMLAFGRSNQEISTKLFISPHTVKSDIKNLFIKLNANDRTSAVMNAIKNNLIDIQEDCRN